MIRNLLACDGRACRRHRTATAAAPRKASPPRPRRSPRPIPSRSRARCRSRRPISRRSRTAIICPRCSREWRSRKREVTAIANQTAAPTFDNTVVAMETSGPAARARRPRVQRGQWREHQRHAAGDRHQDRAAVRRAQRLHLSEREALPALQISARPSGRAEPQPRAGEAARRLLQAVRACGRGAVRRPSRPSSRRSTSG